MSRKTIRTMEELASEIEVSRPTLSRYFHDPESVRQGTRSKIEERLRSVDYVPNFFARNLNRKRTRLIGVVVPHLNDIFQTSLINAIDAAAAQNDCKIIIQNSNNDPRREAAAKAPSGTSSGARCRAAVRNAASIRKFTTPMRSSASPALPSRWPAPVTTRSPRWKSATS